MTQDRRRRPWSRWDSWLLATVASTLCLALVVVLVLSGAASWVDDQVARFTHNVVSDQSFLVDLLVLVDRITDPWVLRVVGLIAAVVLLRRGEHRLAAWLATSVLLSWPVELLTKWIIGRPRPSVEEPLTVRAGFSMPSGHALTAMIVIGALLVLGLRQPGAPRRRLGAWLAASLTLAAIGLDRIALNVHYLTDVLAGWMLGLVVLGVTALAFGLARPIRRRRSGARKRVAVVLNPTKVDVRDFRRQLDRLAAEFGWEPPIWFETTAFDAGRAMTRAALAARVDLVVAAGGDGTVRMVCTELANTEVPIGIVPAGTGNLLVRNLGLPLDPESAIRVALTGRDRRIDLVRASGDDMPVERFAVMGGLGMDAAIVGDAPPRLKAQVGWPAYVVSMARNITYPAIRVDIAIDGGRPVRRWARFIVIGNVGTLHAGLPLLPFAAPDDGLLDVVVVAPRRFTDWPVLAWRVLRRSAVRDDRLAHWRGRRVDIRSVDKVPRQLDGDVVGTGYELHCQIEPGVLLVRVPDGL